MPGRGLSVAVLLPILLALPFGAPRHCLAAATAVQKNQELSFGRVAGGSGVSGTVTISAAALRSYSGSVVPLGTAFSPARFTITGNPGKTYQITLPTEMTVSSGADTMTVTSITASVPLSGVIPAGGSLPFAVGATLVVNGTQRNSTYSGSLAVTVK